MMPRSAITILATAGLARAQVSDPSFETSGPLYPSPAPWTQFSTNFGTPLCDGACFGPGEPTAARTGQWWAWFGGIDTAVEHGIVSQSITIPAGPATLTFYLNTDSNRPDAADVLRVLLDASPIFTLNSTQLAPYAAAYAPVVIDITAFAGATRTLQFEGHTQGGGFLTNFFVDDVTIEGSGGCYPNCDGSTATPRLTANDFQCFLNKYAANSTYANCDGSTLAPVLTANDFQCFLNKYAAGCS